MLVNIVANLYLIPRAGYMGAAIATVLSEVTLLIFFGVAIQRHLGGVSLAALPWRALPAGAILFAVVWPLREANLALVVIAGAAIYFLAVWLGGALKAEERNLLARLLRLRSR